MSTMFYTSRGDLTAYALACGGVQSDARTGYRLEKWGNDYKVLYGYGKWDSFVTLAEARKAFRTACKA